MHGGGGACMAGAVHGNGVYTWQGDMHGRGCVHGWGGVAGETATAVDGMHPIGMHSC